MKIRNRIIIKLKQIILRDIIKITPIQRVFKKLREHGLNTKEFEVLEFFGGSGEYHTKDYLSKISTIDVWEINQKEEKNLRKNLPNANIKITDSFYELKNSKKKYDLIVVDNPMSLYSKYCEHFDIFPDIFNLAKDSCVLIVNIIPEVNEKRQKQYPYLFNETQLAARKSFYHTHHPEKISFHEMVESYKKIISENGFLLEWSYVQKRNYIREKSMVYYMVLKIQKA